MYPVETHDYTSLQSTDNHAPEYNPSVWQRLIQWLHKQKAYDPKRLTDPEPRAAIEETRRILAQPLKDISIKQEIPAELTTALEENIFWFSGFKTHHELVEASRMLKGEDGNFKPFQQFSKDVETLNKTYNKNYLRAEYNFATASSQMAVKWKEWEQDGDRYDLQYRTAGDDRVREEHAALDGTTLPPSDPFWDHYLPPNGWNCRCTAVQVRKGKYPRSNSKEAIARGQACTSKPKQQIFRFNPGKQEKIFPPKHPYFPKGCGNCQYRNGRNLSYNPNNPSCQACDAIYKCIEKFRNNDMKVAAQSDLRSWTKKNLPIVKVGKFESRRFDVNFDGFNGIINNNSYKEIANKGKSDEQYIERLLLAKKIHLNADKFKYLPQADEPGRDHPDAVFKVFRGSIDGFDLQIKLKCNRDGNILWALKIIK